MEIKQEDVESWLASLGCTTWGGQGWTITNPDQAAQAASWFISQMRMLQEHASSVVG